MAEYFQLGGPVVQSSSQYSFQQMRCTYPSTNEVRISKKEASVDLYLSDPLWMTVPDRITHDDMRMFE